MSEKYVLCRNCGEQFEIESSDIDFYRKMNIPPPTRCPACRLQRRLATRNERSLYRRNCERCNTQIIANVSPDKPLRVFCKECWWGDGWNPMDSGRDYDFSRPFFTQFRELQEAVPRPNLMGSNAVNSDYCNYFGDVKNSYLCFGSIAIEDCMYGSPYESKQCVDTHLARECEYCYECVDCEKLSACSFCQDCSNSLNLWYCFDCKNCENCIGCAGLRNAKYCIFNQQYSKEEYAEKRKELLRGGREGLATVEREFERIKIRMPHRYARIIQSLNVTGDHIVQSKNAYRSFDVKKTEDSAYCIRMIGAKDARDTNYCEFLEQCYDYIGFWKNTNARYSNTCGECNDVTYSDFCSGSSHLFGCVGLRNKQYCILNKQYSKEAYEALIVQIWNHMDDLPYVDRRGREHRFGEFMPIELSLFAYNETVAQEYFPLHKEEALRKGYAWKDREEKGYIVTVLTDKVPASIDAVPASMTNETIACAHGGSCEHQCTAAFRVIQAELQFYKRMGLPLPLLCPNCRHHARLAKRNPFQLWNRRCACEGASSENGVYANAALHFHPPAHSCPNQYKTAYDPQRPEIIYCEQCYQAEVV